jgi:hypothetical protein
VAAALLQIDQLDPPLSGRLARRIFFRGFLVGSRCFVGQWARQLQREEAAIRAQRQV